MEDTGEAHLSAAPDASRAQARLPGAYGVEERPHGSEPAAREGAQAPRGVRVQEVEAGPLSQREQEPARAERFLPEEHLRRRADFVRVQRDGERVHTRHYVVALLARAEGSARLGITVTKKIAGSVGRNRIKRVLREVFRRNRDLFPAGCDLVIIAKSGALELDYEDARGELRKARRAMTSAAARKRPERSSV